MQTTTQSQMRGGCPDHFQRPGLMEGSARDEDGVDRVHEPPESLIPLLIRFKDIAKGEGIHLYGQFEAGGGTRFGTISKGQFQGLLVKSFRTVHFTDAMLLSITDHYGTGLPDQVWGGCVEIAWKDFCEDVEKAEGFSGHSGGVAGRDADGTVDLVGDPPEVIKEWLMVLQLKNKQAGIDLFETFRGQGAHPGGKWAKGQFTLALRCLYKEFTFKDSMLDSFSTMYGCGDNHPAGGKTHVAWKDFCEDVNAGDMRCAQEWMNDMVRSRGAAVIG